ncbi:MAG TPA: hypothetical protein VFO34_11765 [Candidatus Acidoferrales bacterium]|nr:hypothetical protein [Candidatus Acidoferrales bacterium]
MEAMMAGTAVIEIFLASLGIAMLMATLALRGMFYLMRSAGQPQIRLRAVRSVQPALAPVAAIARRMR